MFTDKKVVLASQSPRRRQLLEQAGISFSVIIQPTDEIYPEGLTIEKIPVHIAYQKALAVQPLCEKEAIILAADTVVVLDNEVIGKPGDKQHALNILHRLERAQQNGGRVTLAFRHHVHAMIHPVDEIDISVSRRTEHDLGSLRQPAR